jgi:hypothetical protein
MEIVEKAVHQEAGITTVEFVADGGNVVSVQMSKDNGESDPHASAEDHAKDMLADVIVADVEVSSPKTDIDGLPSAVGGSQRDASITESPAVQSLRSARTAKDTGILEEQLDEGLELANAGRSSSVIVEVNPTWSRAS